MSDSKRCLVVTPTYNEEDNITVLINSVQSALPEAEILFVDDNSQDKTQELIVESKKKFPGKIHMIRRPGKMGLASAYLDGFRWGLQHQYDILIQMDADLSHDPNVLPTMVALLTDYDVVIGSRYVSGGGTKNWGLLRKIISKGGSLYAQTLLGLPIKDCTAGFNAWKADTLRKLQLDNMQSEGYCFQIELKYRAYQNHFKIKETPITFVDRRAGYSKMSSKIVIEAMLRVPLLRKNH